ncbi:glycoside hydrolase family 3 C-terminal domain-containing protein [Leifsonia shinshuensis]|uniref:beta-glucosidase family protein n=1 Tax=Leifsonia shinshuensis TaxID=150026 RepID=UPI001F50E030|nr:glycoside hydrolase family 3 C-terminal domain-containing protein [Leifsonia shinshuensis]MCI0158740.1 glycoside hydrolase family 3 C-terminal domain-containing protein [Leifsonia shinshuensis]
MSTPTTLGEPANADAIEAVSLPERIALLTGATSWTLHPVPAYGMRAIVLSDGPIGVRGVDEDERPSAQLPSPSALAATFDRDLLARLGGLLAREAHRKGVDVVLAPVVNLQRTPYGGRHFEAFSEDPYLTGELASQLIRATQAAGVAMCVKHFLGNESETERTTYIARIPERALREVYLAPFEKTVRDARVWSVMAAYNGVDDGTQVAPATEHGSLLNGVLKAEWGFDGVVVSDWLATKTTVEAALGGLDLIMPGPDGPWGARLERAVRDGLVAEEVIDDKVERIVRLGRRVGAVGPRPAREMSPDLPAAPSTRGLLREAVARSSVVLANNGLLPLRESGIASLALIGPNAVEPFIQGGGSASVTAPFLSEPVHALQEALPNTAITVQRGASGRRFAPQIASGAVTTPAGDDGYRITYYDEAGATVGGPVTVPADETWNRDVPAGAREARLEAIVHLAGPGTHRVEVGVSGWHVITFDGTLVAESAEHADHDVILDSSANHPAGPAREYVIGEPATVSIESRQQVVDAGAYGRFVRFALRHELRELSADDELLAAVEAARAADVAVVIVGTNEETESEGWDRVDLQLPGRQNELVERVLDANPRTVVVVNAGAPVILPWLERAPAVLWWWLPGQEAGRGLADALLGVTEPSGRLPWTLPSTEDDVPVRDTVPRDGVIDYAEGIHVGYRQWDRLGRSPSREFGFGLGFGSWLYETLTIVGQPDDLAADVTLTNMSAHDSRETVQIYLESPNSTIDRPVRWLAGFAGVDVPAGETASVRIRIERRALETWNSDRRDWEILDGRYLFHAARSSRDVRLTAATTVHEQTLTVD